jgi:GNAT superfamily N-acetyltransferase
MTEEKKNRTVTVTTWHLEMLDPAQLRPARLQRSELVVMRAQIPSPEFGRFLYTAIGGDWYWLERLDWSYDRWLEYLSRPEVENWVAYLSGTPAGYIELEAQANGNVEIVYFGLLRQFIGQGIGGHLLTVGVESVWAMGARRVWLHTCTLDGPHALANYQARGFRIFKVETKIKELPSAPPGPWPGATKS